MNYSSGYYKNWANEDEYSYLLKKHGSQFAWEFLRRNYIYQQLQEKWIEKVKANHDRDCETFPTEGKVARGAFHINKWFGIDTSEKGISKFCVQHPVIDSPPCFYSINEELKNVKNRHALIYRLRLLDARSVGASSSEMHAMIREHTFGRKVHACGGYRGLYFDELTAICHYVNNDPSELDELLKGHLDLSEGMREFLADIVTGRLKKRRGKPITFDRDFQIYKLIARLLSDGRNLTSNSKSAGAAAIVADELGIEEDTAIQAYYRIGKPIKTLY